MSTTPGGPGNPTWYDVLGLDRDATPEEVKAAWRTATDRFEPGSGSGQFRMFNEAADVLLDPERRAAYDASLAPEPAASPVQLAQEPGEPDHAQPDHAQPEPVEPEPGAQEPAAPAEPASRRLLVLTAVLLVLTVGAVTAAVLLGLKVRSDGRVADARDEAPAAAERAATAMLAYDYRQLPEDRDRAAAYLSEDFEEDYLENFELLEKQKDGTPGAAVQTKTVVTASVLGSGVMDAEEDRVRVLVYVNQTSTRPGRDPQIFQNRVAMTMEKTGDRWLVDGLKSY